MAFYTSVVVAPLKSFANHSKNMQTCFERIPSKADKKRFAARLRKIRWRIYLKIRLKKRRLKQTFDYYQKQVERFLKDFSTELQPKETSIWSGKLTKTSADVHTFIRNVKNVTKKDVKAQTCLECSNKLDSVLFMLSSVLHLVKTGEAKRNDLEDLAAKEKSEEPAAKAAAKANIDAAEPVVKVGDSSDETIAIREAFEGPNEDGYDEIVVAVSVHENAFTEDVQVVKKPVDKESDDHNKRVRNASNQFLASSGKLGKICPLGIHVGYAIYDCGVKCETLWTLWSQV